MLIAIAAFVGSAILFIGSHPAGPGFAWLAMPILGLLSVGCWLGVGIHSIAHRRLPLGLVIAPLIGVLTFVLVYTPTASRLRFNLVDRPALEAIVAQAPAPVITLPDRELTEDESYETFDSFSGNCPSVIGLLLISECGTFAAGYLFYDQAGFGFNDGGIAYLPAGPPEHDVGNGSFESPTFVHLAGPWYTFASSW